MPLNDERPTSTSTSEDQSSDTESLDRHDSVTSSDAELSRQSFMSESSSKHSSPSCSPPKTLTLDEVMASAEDLSKLCLAHEIIVNRDFRLDQPDPPPNSLHKRVKEIVHKAFWDCLESELNEEPPEYEHAIRLLEEIRETLLSFLNPGANRMRTQIMEVLDMDLIRQQADNDAVDIQGLASYVINTMGKLCAPMRDDEVKKLRETPGDIVSMFKEIFRVLDLMKMDLVNFTITTLRPELQKNSVEYERAKFQSIVEKTPSALDETTNWIKSSLEEVLISMPPGPNPTEPGDSLRTLPSPMLVFNTAFVHLLFNGQKIPFPETLMTDEGRLKEMQRHVELLKTVATVLLLVYNNIGDSIFGLPILAEKLKKITSVLLEGMHNPHFNLTEALENISAPICCELNKSLTERNYPPLSSDLQLTLKGQICSIAQENNPIRCVVESRFKQYFMSFLSMPKSNANPPPTPNGLGCVQPELGILAANSVCMINYNKQVYGPFYMRILKKLLFSSEPSPGVAQTSASASIQGSGCSQ
ncbi:T-complex protein 11-like protein 2 isoform X1 [Denticeps clupeoides]|uniref:T-complex protein 11-like protein 2 n=1 Tax=Denticeps clupeoides TaxID=299321 RepID=A0AAY4DUZ7_9TELE|nr:T-complex protein 11-like protein 2 isoform X1 [Denticeps clupeoides]XP_028810866.1 T-complex protein 11-like protein 2 isoform X1 [Denticeps clupeoides]XP_028810867.1 T-complex protein 11-like protein 2 isoform X1 [Denticeps clupeoides]